VNAEIDFDFGSLSYKEFKKWVASVEDDSSVNKFKFRPSSFKEVEGKAKD